MGHRVQWERIRASMHRVDSAGIISRLTQLGCVVRRTYSVPSPGALMMSLWHSTEAVAFFSLPVLALFSLPACSLVSSRNT